MLRVLGVVAPTDCTPTARPLLDSPGPAARRAAGPPPPPRGHPRNTGRPQQLGQQPACGLPGTWEPRLPRCPPPRGAEAPAELPALIRAGPPRRPRQGPRVTDERRRLLVVGVSHRNEAARAGAPGLLTGGWSPPKAPSNPVHQQAAGGGRLLGGGRAGEHPTSAPGLPPHRDSVPGERPAPPRLVPSPCDPAAAPAQPSQACGPLNEGWPLLVIKISEAALKRKPLGRLGRPRAALP